MRFPLVLALALMAHVAAADDLESLVAPIGVEVSVPGAEPVSGVPDATPARVMEKAPSRLPLWIGLGTVFAVADLAILTWVLKRRRASLNS